MPYVAVSNSPIRVHRTTDPGFGNIGGGADPGYGHPEGGHPDQGLPGGGEIDNSLPMPPPGVWPPPVASHPIVPAPPGTPPGTIWPPVNPPRPSQGLPGGSGGRPDNTLPGSQPGPDNTLPGGMPRPDNTLPSGKFWVVAGIPGYGWKYICVDPSLTPDHSLPGGSGGRPDQSLPGSQPHPGNRPPGSGPDQPDNTLPPTATPRR